MKTLKRMAAAACALCLCAVYPAYGGFTGGLSTSAEDISNTMEWGALRIGGGGFVSSVVTGQKNMYARTDVGGAYKYNYETDSWEQLFGFLTDADRGLLSVSGIAFDPTDDDTAYFLCGCAYFSDAKTVIFKTTDGGKTFTEYDVTDMIQVHANGDGRECTEPIAVDPDNPDIIYAGGDVTAGDSCLIKSTDGGKTWNPVKTYDDLGMFKEEIKWPTWTEHMVRATEDGAYNTQNGVCVVRILDGKVYVGTAIKGQTNIHVASVKDDKFEPLSKDLPTDVYPVSISYDGKDNLFFTYIGGLAFAGGSGGMYKYNLKTGDVKETGPSGNAFGTVYADKNDPNKLVTRTCGVWSDQLWQEWSDEQGPAWGDHFFRSTDGGETWTDVTPGQKAGEWGKEYMVSNYLQDGGYEWIRNKACHWGSSMVIDPMDPDKVILTSGNGMFACDNIWD
ncbi:MAG: 1,4-beta-glucanase, partial [Ruminococcus sp.]|nr:1,4-beta-glucanase [Ruminococcus sp.]